MVQLALTEKFKHQVLQWDGATVHMQVPSGLIGQYNPNKHDMREVVMQTAEPASTREYTEIMIKILDITYVKEYFKQVADNATQLNDEETTQLLSLLEDFEDLFGGTLGVWATETIDRELS